jgi:tetratricopeptide (TPR) repeat protein
MAIPVRALPLPATTSAGVAPDAGKLAGLLEAGRADELLRLLGPMAESSNAVVQNYLCRTYYALHRWDKAVHHGERAVRLDASNAIYRLWLGRAYGEKAAAVGGFAAFSLARKTLAAFEAAHRIDRQSGEIVRDLGEYYAEAPGIVGGGRGKALALATEIEAAHPCDTLWLRARTYDSAKDFGLAETAYNELIRCDHGSAESYLWLARFLQGRHNETAFDQAIHHAMGSSTVRAIDHYDTAELLLRARRNLAEAKRQMQGYLAGHTVEDGPAFRAHFLLGEILLAQGERVQAASEYKAALALAAEYRPAADALAKLGLGKSG